MFGDPKLLGFADCYMGQEGNFSLVPIGLWDFCFPQKHWVSAALAGDQPLQQQDISCRCPPALPMAG